MRGNVPRIARTSNRRGSSAFSGHGPLATRPALRLRDLERLLGGRLLGLFLRLPASIGRFQQFRRLSRFTEVHYYKGTTLSESFQIKTTRTVVETLRPLLVAYLACMTVAFVPLAVAYYLTYGQGLPFHSDLCRVFVNVGGRPEGRLKDAFRWLISAVPSTTSLLPLTCEFRSSISQSNDSSSGCGRCRPFGRFSSAICMRSSAFRTARRKCCTFELIESKSGSITSNN